MCILRPETKEQARMWGSNSRALALLLAIAGGAEPLMAGEASPEAAEPARARIRLFLTEAKGKPGELVSVRLTLMTNVLLRSIKVAINFDESLLRLEGLERAVEPPISPLDDVAKTQTDNTDETPGDQFKEGWITLEVTAEKTVGTLKWPTATEIPLYMLNFRILETAKPGRSPVIFARVGSEDSNLAFGNEAEVEAALMPGAVNIPPEDLEDGGVIVLGLGEIGFFLRADTNLDRSRDISDPIRTLRYLFNGDAKLLCFDAADANDDGNLDVSDAVYTLYWLYATGTPPPAPDDWGPDPTKDGLCCEETGGCG